jgi:hypothetical protein
MNRPQSGGYTNARPRYDWRALPFGGRASCAQSEVNSRRAINLDMQAKFCRSFTRMKTKIRSLLSGIAFSSLLAIAPNAEAVIPPPDGGYAGFNTAEGQNALFNLTTGAANTAVGWFSLFSDTEASFNTATGAGDTAFQQRRQQYGVWRGGFII